MTQFSSKTPRDLNHDPEQWVHVAPDFERYTNAEEWEYEVTYSSAGTPILDGHGLRRTSGIMPNERLAQEFAEVVGAPQIRRRTKAVPAGPWEPVEAAARVGGGA